MNDVSTNDTLPSAADNLSNDDARSKLHEVASSAISAEALSAKVEELSERVDQFYGRANTTITRGVDPIPSLTVVAVAGFVLGYVCAWLRA
jgi:hypothetical protein